jgi:hypothetical protein
MTDTLDTLEVDVLNKLAMVAEGRSSDYCRPNLHRAHPGSTPPPGANGQNGSLGPITSLMEYHKALMLKASERGFSARLMAIAEAHADYNSATKRQPTYNTFDSDQNTADRDAAILVHFEGVRPEWPAAVMKCSCSHVEKLRRKSGRDAILGERLDRTEAFAA